MRLPMYSGVHSTVRLASRIGSRISSTRDEPVVGDAEDQRRVAPPALGIAVGDRARLDEQLAGAEVVDDVVRGLVRAAAGEPAVLRKKRPASSTGMSTGRSSTLLSSKSSVPQPGAMCTSPVPSSRDDLVPPDDAVVDRAARPEVVERTPVAPADELAARLRLLERAALLRLLHRPAGLPPDRPVPGGPLFRPTARIRIRAARSSECHTPEATTRAGSSSWAPTRCSTPRSATGEAAATRTGTPNLGPLLGKMDPDRPTPERWLPGPANNPFRGRSGARPEIYTYGLRNPYRFSFDRGGAPDDQRRRPGCDRGDRLRAGRCPGLPPRGGYNFGWDVFEGRNRYESGSAPAAIPPVIQHSQDARLLLNHRRVRDPRPLARRGWTGRYVYGDYCEGTLRRPPAPPAARHGTASGGHPRLLRRGRPRTRVRDLPDPDLPHRPPLTGGLTLRPRFTQTVLFSRYA